MINKERIPNGKPIAVYNAEKRELIGIFRTPSLVRRYIYKQKDCRVGNSNVSTALRFKSKIKNSNVFQFNIALRYANDAQILDLQEKDVLILNGYPEMSESDINGFHGLVDLRK